MDESAVRVRIIAVARTWLGTPFHDTARIKGVGTDCAQFVAGVYVEAKATPEIETPHYSAQWFLHKTEERLAAFVRRYGHEIAEAAVKPGDLILYKYGHCFAHAAIVVDWPKEIIHAHKLSGCVLSMRPFDADLRGRQVKFFSLW